MTTNAFVIHPNIKNEKPDLRTPDTRLEEAVGLASALDLNITGARIENLPTIRAGMFFGSGKLSELKDSIKAADAELVIIDTSLSPVQQRNLEKEWSVKILDRTGLILEIFGYRAQTKEGTLQVELAHLLYQKSRLVRSWTHLERQRGGLGFVGGPGETQIEADRRMIDMRVERIRRQLEKVVKTRGLHRKKRKKAPHPVVALVGYTNAGKSTIFNSLTSASVLAADKLFATLDPTMRSIVTASGRHVILSDTVGFVSDLPTQLVAAFRATLEEVLEADVLVHVRDVSSPETDAQARDVKDILKTLGITEPQMENAIEVYNKCDLLTEDELQALTNEAARKPNVVMASALEKSGIDTIIGAIDARLSMHDLDLSVAIPVFDGKALAWLYKNANITARDDTGTAVCLNITISHDDAERFKSRFGYELT